MKLKVDYFSKWLFVFIALGLCNFAFAQRTITGTVTDASSGEPLIGANILIVGTSSGTITDFDGKYSLEVPEGSTQLEFSYTGYTSQTVAITASNVLDLALSAGELLDEVVVVGYGTQKAKEVTSSVVSVKAEDFNGGNVNDASQFLQGKVAGLTIARSGGNPNDGFNIRLRGLSTIGANTEPLVVIDGVVGASLESVDPNDIASIDVLKDGSAAAIYGTRASSGVILVTTKRGEEGRSQIDYSGYVAFESIANTAPVASAEEFVANGGTDLGERNDLYDILTRTGLSHVHNVAFSGGTGKTNYRVSLNYRNVEGVANATGFDQWNGRINLTQKALNDRLTVTMNLSLTNRQSQFGFDEVFRYAAIFNPTAALQNADGSYFEQDLFDYFNPLAIQEQNTNEGERKDLFGNVQAQYELFSGFKAGIRYSQQRTNQLNGQYYSKTAKFRGAGRNGLAQRTTLDDFNELFELTVNYDKDFGKLNFGFVGGYSFQDFERQGFEVNTGNFIRDDFTFNNFAASLDLANGQARVISGREDERLVAFFGRASFNYDDTYFLQASVRREGSSRFGENNKWGVFPAVSGGVTLSNLFDSGLDNLKLRVGYGVTGNRPARSYLSLDRFNSVGNFPVNGTFVQSFGPSSNANPDLKWETKAELNVGLDFALMDYKFTGSIEFYTRSTEDGIQLVNVPVPPNLFPQTWTNVGEIENTGLEIALSYLAIDKPNFTWEPSITFSTFSSKLVKFTNDRSEAFRGNVGAPGQNGTNMVRLAEGEDLGQLWGPVFVGLNDDGSWGFQDVNGDGNIEVGFGEPDNAIIGNGLPDFEFGFNNSFTFGNFDLNFFFRGAIGHDLVNTYRVFYEQPNFFGAQNGVITDLFLPGLTSDADFNSYHVENGSFVKLDNATLGYNMPLSGSTFRNLRFYISGQNLIVITDYQGVDPEVQFTDPGDSDNAGQQANVNVNDILSVENPDALAPGIERRNQWARTRTITFGINLGF